jgi:hypothetical protein
MVSRTMTGEGQAYPNNSYSIGCFKDRSECWLKSIQQIGNRLVSQIDTPYQYEIQKWTEHEIVAGDDGTFGCYRITITIDRQSKEALWVEEGTRPSSHARIQRTRSENTRLRARPAGRGSLAVNHRRGRDERSVVFRLDSGFHAHRVRHYDSYRDRRLHTVGGSGRRSRRSASIPRLKLSRWSMRQNSFSKV